MQDELVSPESPERRIAEATRQFIHIASGLWAYCLRWVRPEALVLLPIAATAFNLWILPRIGGRWLWRDREKEMGRAEGLVLYPLTVCLLLLIFIRRPDIAAVGWGLLAFGDGVATLIGRSRGKTKLPWNPSKSWAGFWAYTVAGGLATCTLLAWVEPGRYDFPLLIGVSSTVALMGAFLESSPQRLDDNLGVPLLAALFAWCCLETAESWAGLKVISQIMSDGLPGLVVNAVLVLLAMALGTLNKNGAAVAYLLGTLVFAFVSWQGYVVLLVFFALGSLATKIGYEKKVRRRLAQGHGGKRRAANALANGGVAAACAVFASLTPHTSMFLFAFACSLAAAAADTVESEIGQVWGRPTLLITSFESVDPGTDGGVSAVGTACGLLAAAVTVAAGWRVGLYPGAVVVPLSLLAVAATLMESVVGATLERDGLLDNEGVNFLNTLLAALLGAALAVTMG